MIMAEDPMFWKGALSAVTWIALAVAAIVSFSARRDTEK